MRSLVSVTEAAASTALISAARVAGDLGLDVTADADEIAALIAEGSDRIAAELGWRPFAETVSETFRPTASCETAEALLLTRTPAGDITAVIEDGTTLASSQYELDPAAGLLYRLSTDGFRSDWSPAKSVVVAYTGGWTDPEDADTTVPPAVQGACLDYIRHIYMSRGRDPMVRAEDVVGVSRTEYWVGSTGSDASALPPDVQAKLRPFIRIAV